MLNDFRDLSVGLISTWEARVQGAAKAAIHGVQLLAKFLLTKIC